MGQFTSSDPVQLEAAPLQAMRLAEWDYQNGSATPGGNLKRRVQRWQSRAGNPQDLNRFSYVLNNPVNHVDLDGYGFWKKLWNKIAKAVTAAVQLVVSAVLTVVGAVAMAIGAAFGITPLVHLGSGLLSSIMAAKRYCERTVSHDCKSTDPRRADKVGASCEDLFEGCMANLGYEPAGLLDGAASLTCTGGTLITGKKLGNCKF